MRGNAFSGRFGKDSLLERRVVVVQDYFRASSEPDHFGTIHARGGGGGVIVATADGVVCVVTVCGRSAVLPSSVFLSKVLVTDSGRNSGLSSTLRILSRPSLLYHRLCPQLLVLSLSSRTHNI